MRASAFEKDRDYIITEAGVEIVDEFTGRVLPAADLLDGVHQAIEAKEKVKVKEADRTVASITFQNFSNVRKIIRHERHGNAVMDNFYGYIN